MKFFVLLFLVGLFYAAAQVYYTQQGSKLVGTGYSGTTIYQGYFPSISADGSTLASGGCADNNYVGAVWIFRKSGDTWSQQGSKIVGTGSAGAQVHL